MIPEFGSKAEYRFYWTDKVSGTRQSPFADGTTVLVSEKTTTKGADMIPLITITDLPLAILIRDALLERLDFLQQAYDGEIQVWSTMMGDGLDRRDLDGIATRASALQDAQVAVALITEEITALRVQASDTINHAFDFTGLTDAK